MLTQLVRDTDTNTTPVFTLYVYRVIVLQWEKKETDIDWANSSSATGI